MRIKGQKSLQKKTNKNFKRCETHSTGKTTSGRVDKVGDSTNDSHRLEGSRDFMDFMSKKGERPVQKIKMSLRIKTESSSRERDTLV